VSVAATAVSSSPALGTVEDLEHHRQGEVERGRGDECARELLDVLRRQRGRALLPTVIE
jgi:hypothetical protein